MSLLDLNNKLSPDKFRQMGWGVTFGYGRYFAHEIIDMKPTMPDWYAVDNFGRLPSKYIQLKYDGGLKKLYSNFGCFDDVEDVDELLFKIEELKVTYKKHSGIATIENFY